MGLSYDPGNNRCSICEITEQPHPPEIHLNRVMLEVLGVVKRWAEGAVFVILLSICVVGISHHSNALEWAAAVATFFMVSRTSRPCGAGDTLVKRRSAFTPRGPLSSFGRLPLNIRKFVDRFANALGRNPQVG